MSTATFTFPDQLMADGTVPQLAVMTGKGMNIVITDELSTWQLLSSLNSPMPIDEIQLELDFEGLLPTPVQTTKILEAMANLMVAISEVGYEMAQAKHEGGEGYED
jgi:hypothetical protein